MKSITINYDVVLIILSSIIILIAARDIIIRKDEKWYKRISLAGWMLIVAAGASGYITLQKIQSDISDKTLEKKEEKKSLDSGITVLENSVNEGFKKHNASFNPVTKTITITDSVKFKDTSKNIIDPVMDVFAKPDSNPKLKGRIDSLKFRIEFGCINNGIAYDIRDKLVIFSLTNSRFNFIGSTKRTVLESSKAYSNVGLWIESSLIANLYYPYKDTTYFYFKVKYSNKPINGNEQSPIQKIYYVIEKPFVYSIKDFSRIYEVENEDLYVSIKKELISKKLW